MKKRIVSLVMAATLAAGLTAVSFTATDAFAAGASAALKAAVEQTDQQSIFENGIRLSAGESRQLPELTPDDFDLTDGERVEGYSYSTEDTDVLKVEESGGRWICTGIQAGSASLSVSCTYADNEYGDTVTTTRYIDVVVSVNMNQVSLPSSVNVYDTGYGSTDCIAVIPISGADGSLDGYEDYKDSSYSGNFDVSVSGSGVKLQTPFEDDYYNSDSYISKDTLYIPLEGKGTATVTVVINGRTYQIKVTLYKVRMTGDGAVLLAKGKTRTLKVTGVSKSQVQWSSSNKKVVSVNSAGKISGRKNGNAIVYARVGDFRFGTAVSVTSAKKVKAVNYGIHIAKTCTYSQAKRMQSGYYDCSALVWKAYHHVKGCNFGSSSYAPTAAEEGKYLAGKNKIVGHYTDSNVNGMKFQAGDVLFKTNESENNNGRYKGIYHAELFAGYVFTGFDWEGQPQITTRWCARENGYGGYEDDIVGRP